MGLEDKNVESSTLDFAILVVVVVRSSSFMENMLPMSAKALDPLVDGRSWREVEKLAASVLPSSMNDDSALLTALGGTTAVDDGAPLPLPFGAAPASRDVPFIPTAVAVTAAVASWEGCFREKRDSPGMVIE